MNKAIFYPEPEEGSKKKIPSKGDVITTDWGGVQKEVVVMGPWAGGIVVNNDRILIEKARAHNATLKKGK